MDNKLVVPDTLSRNAVHKPLFKRFYGEMLQFSLETTEKMAYKERVAAVL